MDAQAKKKIQIFIPILCSNSIAQIRKLTTHFVGEKKNVLFSFIEYENVLQKALHNFVWWSDIALSHSQCELNTELYGKNRIDVASEWKKKKEYRRMSLCFVKFRISSDRSASLSKWDWSSSCVKQWLCIPYTLQRLILSVSYTRDFRKADGLPLPLPFFSFVQITIAELFVYLHNLYTVHQRHKHVSLSMYGAKRLEFFSFLSFNLPLKQKWDGYTMLSHRIFYNSIFFV